jgi:hypothetical protein
MTKDFITWCHQCLKRQCGAENEGGAKDLEYIFDSFIRMENEAMH